MTVSPMVHEILNEVYTKKSSFLFKAPLPIVQTVGMFENIHRARQVTHTYHRWEEGYSFKKKKVEP